ncbi:hypothetical protein [Methylohalobius crimeensis]|uniref:hypothetical protein n=1 Tax=Methylohalobius crimeensis TaxID=244365 RepID=UPI0003B5D531|nr:hypothetical protein [Methylohalobius crimeensis]
MLKATLYSFLTAVFLVLVSPSTLVAQEMKTEAMQQEEVFSQPVEELTKGEKKDEDYIPVYSHIYGAQFMTEQERCEYLLKLDGMKTREERDAFREQHHKKIDELRKRMGG